MRYIVWRLLGRDLWLRLMLSLTGTRQELVDGGFDPAASFFVQRTVDEGSTCGCLCVEWQQQQASGPRVEWQLVKAARHFWQRLRFGRVTTGRLGPANNRATCCQKCVCMQ